MEIQNSVEIKGKPLFIQCTWANAFTSPVWDRGLCIRSFDRVMLKQAGAVDASIGVLTGNYTEDASGTVWVESSLKYTDRRPVGWFRLSDVWFDGKDGDKNTEDFVKPETKKGGAIVWLTAALSALSLLR